MVFAVGYLAFDINAAEQKVLGKHIFDIMIYLGNGIRFAEEYKQPIPAYIRRLGIVTSPTGAAVQDIRNIASRRLNCSRRLRYCSRR